METICPSCSEPVSGGFSAGDLVDCPACGATFEALPPRTAPLSADDALRRAEIHAAEQRLRRDLAAADRQKVADGFDRAIAATDAFGKKISKIGARLFLAVLLIPLLFYALFVLWNLL